MIQGKLEEFSHFRRVIAASAGDLPETVVAAVKLAVRQHRNEVWRKHNQPYVLYGAIAAVLGLMVLTTVGLILRAALSRPKRP